MRRRLLASTLAVAVLAVVLLGLPLALVGARLIHSEARQRLEETATRIASDTEDRLEHRQPITADRLRLLAARNRSVRVSLPHDGVVTVGSPGSGQLTASVPMEEGGLVTVGEPRRLVTDRVREASLLVLGLVLVSTGVAVGLAVVQAKRLGEPLEDLAGIAERFGSGDTRTSTRRYGVPEIDRVAAVLDRSAARVGELLRRERDFATDASHQLRTPLTALSIRLEEIAMSEDREVIREEAAAALAQVERLASVVDSLLARARSSRVGQTEHLDVIEVLRAQTRDWDPAYRKAGRRLQLENSTPGLIAAATPGGLAQAVAALLDNALVHGRGTVTLRVRPAAEHVVVEVADEGPGIVDRLVPHVFERSVSGAAGTGLGLALARALVEADGGRLELVRSRPATFAIFLPVSATVPAGR